MATVAVKPERSEPWALSRHRAGALFVITAGILIGGCQTHPRAPIEQKSATPASGPVVAATPVRPASTTPARAPDIHVVARGDTLHGIAWRYGLDSRDLVRWNRLANPDLIYVGQRLRLTAPEPAPAKRAAGGPVAGASAPRVAEAPVRQAPATAPAPKVAPSVAATAVPNKRVAAAPPVSGWTWPADGKVTQARSVSGTRGIEIRGQRGQDVRAAASGKVVYSGSGLRGYGELIIIKHDETYLSAYAHNETRLVQEGQAVQSGQVIARMGDTEARDVMLHFEIRRNGKSTDPYQYLPKR